MNDCKFKKVNAILFYINSRFKDEMVKEFNQRHIAETLYRIKQSLGNDKHYESFETKLQKINGDFKEDNRTDAEIEKDVFKMFEGE